MNTHYVKIKKCGNENAWYFGHEGDTVEVKEYTETHYQVVGSDQLLKKDDVRVLLHRFAD